MASARKVRDRDIPQAEFEIDLEDALDALLDPGDVTPGDKWHFQVDENVLKISRIRAPVNHPLPPGNAPLAARARQVR